MAAQRRRAAEAQPAVDYDEAAQELYALRPGEFTAARNELVARARAAGQRDVGARLAKLRRPTVGAWLANRLVRDHPEEVKPLRETGAALREAQRTLAGKELQQLSVRRRQLVFAFLEQAQQTARDAGQPVGDQALRELEETLHAVLADEQAAEAFAAGRLVHGLSAGTGFPGVAEGAEAAPGTPTPAARPRTASTRAEQPENAPSRQEAARRRERERQQQRARQAVERAERDLAAAREKALARQREVKAADAEARELGRAAQEARRAAEEARTAAERTEKRHDAATAAAEKARERHAAAARAVDDAQERVRQARETAEAD